MSNNRYIKLSNLGISQERYNELSYFVAQYREWKFKQKNDFSDKREKKIRMIDDIAERSSMMVAGDPGLAQYIIINVTEGRPCFYLKNIMGMPYNEKLFYGARMKFFSILNDEKD